MANTLTLDGCRFSAPVRIAPERTARGRVRAFMPQSRYVKADVKRLNPHGGGPFCRFLAEGLPPASGVYALTIDGVPTYVGKAYNLAQRWSMQGYGAISPANCFTGGQPTNCRINHAIFVAAGGGRRIEVWGREDCEPGGLETRLIRALRPPWNIRIP